MTAKYYLHQSTWSHTIMVWNTLTHIPCILVMNMLYIHALPKGNSCLHLIHAVMLHCKDVTYPDLITGPFSVRTDHILVYTYKNMQWDSKFLQCKMFVGMWYFYIRSVISMLKFCDGLQNMKISAVCYMHQLRVQTCSQSHRNALYKHIFGIDLKQESANLWSKLLYLRILHTWGYHI